MVKAGEATDQQIEALAPLLEPGDLIVDGGNARYPGHDPARPRAARARPAVLRHRHLGRRGGRPPRPLDHGGRRRGGLCAGRAGLRGDRRQGRRRAVLRPHRPRRRRPFRQDAAQRHRICRHAADRRDLRRHEGCARPRLSRDAGDLRRVEPRRARFLPDRDHGRHPRQDRPRDRPADGRDHPRSRRAEGHRRLGGRRRRWSWARRRRCSPRPSARAASRC